MHKVNDVGKETVVIVKPQSSACFHVPVGPAKDTHYCLTCKKVFTSLQSLRLHQFWKHEVSSANDIALLESEQHDSLVTGSAGIDHAWDAMHQPYTQRRFAAPHVLNCSAHSNH